MGYRELWVNIPDDLPAPTTFEMRPAGVRVEVDPIVP